MDFPLMVTSDQGYAAASDVPFPTDTFSSLSESPFSEPINELDFFLDFSCNHHFSVDDLYKNGSSQASPALRVDTPTVITGMSIPAGAAHSDCKLQPRVYNLSTASTGVYFPPPSGEVVEFQCQPPDQPLIQHDSAVNMVVPLRVAVSAVHPMWPDVSACEKTPPASGVSLSSYLQPGADTNNMYCEGKPPQYPSSFSFPHAEAQHMDMLPCHDVLPAGPQLTSPNYISPQIPLHSFMRIECRLPMLDVPTSPTADAYGAMSGTSTDPPAYVQSNIFSAGVANSQNSVAMETSSVSAPAALPLSNSSMNQTFTQPENGSFAVPTSPTPSVNKGVGSTRGRSPCSTTLCKVAFKVETKLLNLHDGFIWKKYGEKVIKGSIFKRSYFKCDEAIRCGCNVLKRTQMYDDGEHILFTYSGRHNHPQF